MAPRKKIWTLEQVAAYLERGSNREAEEAARILISPSIEIPPGTVAAHEAWRQAAPINRTEEWYLQLPAFPATADFEPLDLVDLNGLRLKLEEIGIELEPAGGYWIKSIKAAFPQRRGRKGDPGRVLLDKRQKLRSPSLSLVSQMSEYISENPHISRDDFARMFGCVDHTSNRFRGMFHAALTLASGYAACPTYAVVQNGVIVGMGGEYWPDEASRNVHFTAWKKGLTRGRRRSDAPKR